MKDITLGQYIPGDFLLYRLDPRVKIVSTLLFTLALFCTSSFLSYLIILFWFMVSFWSSGLRLSFVFQGLKGFMGLICVTALFGVFFTPGTPYFQWGGISVTYEGMVQGAEIVARFVLLVIGASLLTYTTSPLGLLYGIDILLRPFRRIGIPAHELAMMMSIALRFLPIMIEEARKIMDAQTARGADFAEGNLLRRGRALVPLLVPLLFSAWKRADELSVAMEARCYHGGEGRTEWRTYRLTKIDYGVLSGVLALTVLIFGLRWL